MTSAQFPSPGFSQLLKTLDASSNVTKEYTRENYAGLTVFMETMSVDTTMIFRKYDFAKVISNTGGLLGILLGGSLMTLYELLDFFASIFYIVFNNIRDCFNCNSSS